MPKHLLMVKRHGGLEPDAMAGEEAYKWLSKVRDGEYVVVEVKDTARKSYKQLRYAFSLLHMAWDSSEALQKWAGNFEVFREEVLIKLGHCDTVVRKDGTVGEHAHSMAMVGGMGDVEFNQFIDGMLDFFDTAFSMPVGEMRAEADRRG